MNFQNYFFPQFLISVFITFSGSIASKRGFSVSKELPSPLDYFIMNRNPILAILADQANHDPLRPPGHLTGVQLRDLILLTLSYNRLEWPLNLEYLTKSQWIKGMKQNPNFYTQQTNCAAKFQVHERLLLNLASKLLKRKICLISLFPEDKDDIIKPPISNPSKPYYLLCCNKAHFDNFYVSIFKDESNVPITASDPIQGILSRNFSLDIHLD